jgi:hypothetical protein
MRKMLLKYKSFLLKSKSYVIELIFRIEIRDFKNHSWHDHRRLSVRTMWLFTHDQSNFSLESLEFSLSFISHLCCEKKIMTQNLALGI